MRDSARDGNKCNKPTRKVKYATIVDKNVRRNMDGRQTVS